MMTKTIRLAIIDDAPILSKGLSSMLHGYRNLEVVITATSTCELLQDLHHQPVDILLVDILRYTMDGQLVKKVKEKFPRIRILVLSMNTHDKAMEYRVLRDAHIAGYLSDTAGSRELITALEIIARGGDYYSNDLSNDEDSPGRRKAGESPRLTGRELEIIRLINREFNNRQIADSLFISERTVETHRKHIYQKTCTNNVIALIKYAYNHRLVD